MTERYEGFYKVSLFNCMPFEMFTVGDCPRAKNILDEQSFESCSTLLWASFCGKATAILDIGAHVGVYSLIAASLRKDITVHAFEPNPYAFARLRVHKLRNKFTNIAEHHVALAAKHGYTNFSWYVKPDLSISSGGSLGARAEREDYPTETVVVEAAKLDTFDIDYGSNPLVKIDVEGGELGVLKGASKLLAAKPTIILESFSQENCDAIGELLTSGYSVYTIIEETGQLIRQHKLTAASTLGRDFNQLIVWEK